MRGDVSGCILNGRRYDIGDSRLSSALVDSIPRGGSVEDLISGGAGFNRNLISRRDCIEGMSYVIEQSLHRIHDISTRYSMISSSSVPMLRFVI